MSDASLTYKDGPRSEAESPCVSPSERADDDRTFIPLTLSNLLWIFIIASVVGLVVETIVSWPIDGELRRRFGLVWGPFSPIYGLGAVLMTAALNNMKQSSPWHLFLAAGIVGSSLEFFGGWFWKNFFGVLAWSYEGQPFNLFGYTSLGMAVCWGAIGLAWMRIALPHVMRLIDRMPFTSARPITIALLVFLIANAVTTLIVINCWFERLDGQPVETPVQMLCADLFDNDFMSTRFGVMTIHTDLADLRDLLP